MPRIPRGLCNTQGTLSAALWMALTVLIGCDPIMGQSEAEFLRQLASLAETGQYEKALEVGLQGLENHPGEPSLSTAVASVAVQSGQLGLGRQMLEQAARSGTGDVGLLLVLADFNLRLGVTQAAVDALKLARRHAPESANIEFRLAEAYGWLGRDEEALQCANRAVELEPDEPSYLRLCALLLERAGRPGDALSRLRKAYRLAPSDTRILLLLADREKRNGRPGEAFEYLELASRQDPENPLFYRELAALMERLGGSEEAGRYSLRAVELEEAFEGLGESIQLARDGRTEEAVAVLQPFVRRTPEFTTGAGFLADLLRSSGREQEALALWESVLERDPGNGRAGEESAWIHFEQGGLDRAIERLRLVSDVGPSKALLEAYRLRLEGNWEGAVGLLREVEAEYPLDRDLLRQLGQALDGAGRSEEALAYLEKAHRLGHGAELREIEAEARRIRFEYASRLEVEGRWVEAIQVLQGLLQEETAGEYWLHLGYCEQRLGSHEEAIRSFRKGLALDREANWARANLALCEFAMGRFRESAEEWQVLLGYERKPEYVYNLGLTRLRQYRLAEAWELISEAADNGDSSARSMLSRRTQTGRVTEARRPGR